MSMARSILLATLVLFLSGSSLAAQELKGGVTLGLNNSWVGDNAMSAPDADTDPRRTLLVGVFVTIPISDLLDLQTELLLSRKGRREEVMERGFERLELRKEVLKLDYVEIPLLLNARVPLFASERFMPRVFAGPYAAYNVGCSFEWGTTESHCGTEWSGVVDLVDGEQWDYGAVIGVGVDREFASGTAGLDLRYTHGLTTVPHAGGVENRVVSISAAYAIPLGS